MENRFEITYQPTEAYPGRPWLLEDCGLAVDRFAKPGEVLDFIRGEKVQAQERAARLMREASEAQEEVEDLGVELKRLAHEALRIAREVGA